MTNTQSFPIPHDPIEANLSGADDRVLLSEWLPPQAGMVPKIQEPTGAGMPSFI